MILPGNGTRLQHGVTTGGGTPTTTYTDIAQCVEITGPGMTVGARDTTTLGDKVKKSAGTITDAGKLGLQVFYDPKGATHSLLYTLFTDPAHPEEKWALVFNDASDPDTPSKGTFPGWVSGFTPGGMDIEGSITADVEITLTDIPVIVPRSSS